MNREIYKSYMQSDKWTHRKSRYFETHEKKCRACESRRAIQLHHKTYVRLGTERDQDLVPLCRRCHMSLHRMQRKTKINLWLTTDNFIRKKRKNKQVKYTKRKK